MGEIKPNLGSKLELERYDDNGELLMPILISQFEGQLPDGAMEILTPIYEGRIFLIHRDTQIGVLYEHKGDLFRFQAVVFDYKKSGNIHLLKIKPTGQIERYQRRTFFRFKCLLDLRYRFKKRNEGKERFKDEYENTVIKDISGGGMCILLNEKPCIDWLLDGILNIGSDIKFKGKIVHVKTISEEGKYKYESGVEFTEIKNNDREKIISYIFDSQRKLLNKGWHKK